MQATTTNTQSGVAFLLLILTVLGTLFFLYSSAGSTRAQVAADGVVLHRLNDTLTLLADLGALDSGVEARLLLRAEGDWQDVLASRSVRALRTLQLLVTNDQDSWQTAWNQGHPLPEFRAAMARLEIDLQRFAVSQDSAFSLLEVGLLATLVALVSLSILWLREERRRRQQLEELQGVYRLSLSALEAERKRIALDLHDTLAQELVGAKMLLAGLAPAPAKSEVVASLDRAQTLVRDLARGLRPPALDALGFEQALRELLSEFQERSGLSVHADFELGTSSELMAGADIQVYRILQEALQNVWKHSNALHVWVTAKQRAGVLAFEVRDDGVGAKVRAESAGTLGLSGMQERAALLGGRLTWEATDGVTVKWEVPLEHSHRG